MKHLLLILACATALFAVQCSKENSTEPEPQDNTLPKGDVHGVFTATAPTVDGKADETSWQSAEWAPIDELWLGSKPSVTDFSGQFKVLWTAEKLYLLVELTDDRLVDKYRDPLDNYWNDDCLEIFIDEDRSQGDHTYNYNAFAYHISYESHAVDIGPNRQPQLYDDHVDAEWENQGTQIVWELAIDIYDDSYQDGAQNTPVTLTEGKTLGFMVAYCDADGSAGRESFIGSIPIAGPDKNLGWQDAGVFGELTLVK